MSEKVKQGITQCLKKIETQTFDEDAVRTLLILSRELIKSDGLIKELAHFIAHTERTQGKFYRKINSRYTKFKLVQEHVTKHDINELRQKIKNEGDLSDFMLGAISIDKIDAKLFDILYFDGLDDLPDSHLIKYTGFKKAQIQQLFKRFYKKTNGYYYITTNTTEKLIGVFRSLPISKFNPKKELEIDKNLTDAEDMVKKIRFTIDRIQKVVRGAIFFASVFSKTSFRKEIETAMSAVVDKLGITKNYIVHVKNNSDDILLCIMTLLHDSRFIFFDKTEAKTFLCSYLSYNHEEAQKPSYNISEAIYNKGTIALYINISGKSSMTIPLFVSHLHLNKYLDYDAYKSSPSTSNISRLIWTTAGRIDGRLQLV